MKLKGKVSKFLGAVTAAVMCITMMPKVPASAASVGQKLTVGGGSGNQQRGTCDGYSYEAWIDTTGGTGSLTLGKGCTFKAEWSASVPSGNFLARRGLDFGSKQKATSYDYIGMDYKADYKQTGSSQGNSRLCVYGWFQNQGVGGNVPLVEYYIIEDWVDWCPDGNGKMVTIDGAQYKIFQLDHNGPSINQGVNSFKQYFSVRQSKRTSGHITVSDHFKAWADQGWGIGNLYEVSLNAEGWQSSGYADVTELDVYTKRKGDDNGNTDTPAESDGKFFSSTFESGKDNWTGRGDASVSLDTNNYYDGKSSLAVTGRTDNWNGAAIELSSSTFVPGNTYSFSTAVLQKSGSAQDMKLTLQYNTGGDDQYDEVALVSAKSGEWTKLENTSFTIPAGATNMILYVEAPDSLTDFYIDNVVADKEGTKSSVVTGKGTVASGTSSGSGNDDPGTPSTSADSLKDKFAACFKVGTSVSPNELNSSTGVAFIKKHFNSITPENELKPDALLSPGTSNTRANVSLSRAAKTLKFCEDNNIAVRGHTFVWHSQTPEWFFKENFSSSGAWVSKDVMDQRLENFIKDTFELIAKEYPKLDLYAYDVCNELFTNNGGSMRPPGAPYDNSYWTQVYGANNDEFVLKAFKYARMYAPKNCKLYINDYNEYIDAKTQNIYDIAMKVKAEGNIDGIGMQSHLATNFPSASQYKKALEKFLSTGLEVQITELDIQTNSNDSARAQLFQDIFQLAVDHADQIPAVTVWGTHDSISWRSSDSPLMFGSNYTPKADYNKVMSIKTPTNAVVTTTTATTTKTTTTTTKSNGNNNNTTKVTLWGDANCDGAVDISDAVIIMQALANPDKFGLNGTDKEHLTAQGKANGDVHLNGNDITAMDALAIQKYLLGSLTKLPESYSDTPAVDNTTAKSTTKATTTKATTTASALKITPTEYMASVRNSFTNNVPSSVKSGDTGKTSKIQYYSKVAGANKSANVWVPAGYDSSKKYNVLYMNHGVFGNEDSMLDSSFAVREMASNLIKSGDVEPFIIVFPQMYSGPGGGSPNMGQMNMDTMDNYDKFLADMTDSLMPYIEEHYSVKTGRENTAIAGFSMGGRESLYLTISRPDLFGYCCASSPAPGIVPASDMFISNHLGSKKADGSRMTNSDFKISGSNMPYLLMIGGGTNDTVVGTFPEEYHNLFTQNSTDHIWESFPGGGHDASVGCPMFYNYIKNLFKASTSSSSSSNTGNNNNNNNSSSTANFFSDTFSGSIGDWEERGAASLSLDSKTYYSAGSSLKVTGRADTWQGAQIALDSSFKAGSTYSFSAAVLQASGKAQDAKMTLQYSLNGEDNYDEIATASAADKTWTKLENTAYTIPAGATKLILYVELPDSTADYYLDDVQVAEKGKSSSVTTGKGTVASDLSSSVTPSTGNIDPSKPMIAISFDDGTKSPYGKRIVNALAKEGFRATFFYVGNWINDESEVKLAYENGMEIANHTMSHPDLSTKSSSEIRSEYDQCAAKLKKIIGAEPSKLLRLPYLASNSTVTSTLKDAPLITCAIDTQDWNGASKDQIVNTVKQAMSNGSGKNAIVLCHETYESTAAAIEELAPYIKAQGWQIVTISEMFAANGKTLNGGQIYTKCN